MLTPMAESKLAMETQAWDPFGVKVSVVIPCFNNASLTSLCLKSLFESTDPSIYEIIIVDDASSDATINLTSTEDTWIRVIRNETNTGFGESCNRGAAEARGDIIVFLNNDAFPFKGWLEPLLEDFERDDELGAVQPKILYPDGTINDAGGLVFAQGAPWVYGKGLAQADAPLVNVRRAPDYVSGACFAVRRKAFEDVGGFDPRYAPAYFEDTDLSFTLRKEGWKLLYEPSSRVAHIEGATNGVDLASGMKRFQDINGAKFREKWASELATRPFLDVSIVDRWAYRPQKGSGPGELRLYATDHPRRILVVDLYAPAFDRASGSKRMLEFIKRLRELGHSVTFYSLSGSGERYSAALAKIGVPLFGGDPSHSSFDEIPYASVHRVSVQQLLVTGGYDTVVLTPWTTGEIFLPTVRAAAPYVKVVTDTCDIHFVRNEREFKLVGGDYLQIAQLKERELAVYRSSDAVVCLTENDAMAIEDQVPHQALIVPNCHELADAGPRFESRSGCLFVGNFLHPPNIDAVRWWRHSVIPLLPSELDGLLRVVGNDPHGLAQRESSGGIQVIGTVDDLIPYYHEAKVAVAPLRYGAGMKGKVGEALSMGTPLVASPTAIEGMGLDHLRNVVVAETAQEFAEGVQLLAQDVDLWTELSNEGREYVSARLGPDTMRTAVNAVMRSLE